MSSWSDSSDSALTLYYLQKFTDTTPGSLTVLITPQPLSSLQGGIHAGETKSKNIKTTTQGFTGARQAQQQTLIILEKSSQVWTWVIAKDTVVLLYCAAIRSQMFTIVWDNIKLKSLSQLPVKCLANWCTNTPTPQMLFDVHYRLPPQLKVILEQCKDLQDYVLHPNLRVYFPLEFCCS